nr:uncharacterized protein LOC111505660 [Leptinotarsa decemlineata]
MKMKRSVVPDLLLVIFFCQKAFCSYDCYTCEGGPLSNCGTVAATGVTEVCYGSYCYEAFILYQNGAMPMVQRRCWQKPDNTNETNFCEWVKTSESIKNSHATVVDCNICSYRLCNTHKRFWESK